MASIPLPELDAHPPNMLEEYARAVSLKGMMQQQQQQQAMAPLQQQAAQQSVQTGQLELQQKTLEMKDQENMRALAPKYVQKDDSGNVVGYDANGYFNGLLSAGVNPGKVAALRSQQAEMTKNLAEAGIKKLDLENATNDQAYQVLEGVRSVSSQPNADPNSVNQAYQAGLQKIKQLGVDTSKLPQQFPGPQGLDSFEATLGIHKQVLADAKTVAETKEADARAKNTAAEMQRGPQPTEASLAVKAAGGDSNAEAALKRLDQSKREGRPVINNMSGSDAKDIADAIENGDQPPTLQGLYRNAGPVRAELARRGVPLAKMEMDWKATQKYVSTLNGTQQTRLRQAVSTASDLADKVDGLYQEYHSLVGDAGMKVFNKAGLAAAKNLPGRAGAVATSLDAQIADLTSDLGSVYMGGNSPTDHALGLAGKNLSGDWNKETFEEGLKQIHENIKIRQNSMNHGGAAGLSGETNYGSQSNQSNQSAPSGQTATNPANGHKIKVQDGKWVDAETGNPI